LTLAMLEHRIESTLLVRTELNHRGLRGHEQIIA
jgi:hypothetical protein